VAELPDLIRGFDEVKQANIERFRLKARAILDSLEDVRSGRPGPHQIDASTIGQSDVA
jgi:hypothetical protein